jgi:ABC-2 type transport system ATP-binding protein
MNDATIQVDGLCKRFGSTNALDGMTFTVRPGQVTGFVGPNGAGKTTTMRVILGLDRPETGRALVCGQEYAHLERPLTHIGALLDASAIQPGRSARNHLLWLAYSQGLGARRVDEVIELVGLRSAAKRKAGGFSLGMRQRLGIAAALLGDPPVLMLDEPVNGMDPEGIVWMRGLLRRLAAEGRAVLISSHLMSELEDTAEHLIVVGRGKVIVDTSVHELLASASAPGSASESASGSTSTSRSGGRVELRTSAQEPARSALEHAGGSVTDTGVDDRLTVTGLAAEKVIEILSRGGIPFSEITSPRASLEQVYMQLTQDSVEYRAQQTREA